LYFVADDGVSGAELWRSDGTASGTFRVRDINPGVQGSDASFLTPVGNTLYFQAYDATNGTELWKSDGTQAGTVLVRNISTGQASSYPEMNP